MTIVTSVDKWALGYGSLEPELLDPVNPDLNPHWHASDHNIGVGRIEVEVLDINSPNLNLNPPSKVQK